MNHLKKQVAALTRLCTAEDESSRKAAKEELLQLMDAANVQSKDAEAEVRRVLTEIGVPEHLVGHPYLVHAVVLAVENPKTIYNMTRASGLYQKIAKEFGTTASRTERSIRHCIENAWDRCDMDVIVKYFGNTVDPGKGKPTNSEFIARVAGVIRYG